MFTRLNETIIKAIHKVFDESVCDFSKWWQDYYSRSSVGNKEHMLGMVESGFVVPTLGKKISVSGRGKKLYFPFSFITTHVLCLI